MKHPSSGLAFFSGVRDTPLGPAPCYGPRYRYRVTYLESDGCESLGGEVDSVGVDRTFVDQATLSDRGRSSSVSESLYDRRWRRPGTTADVRYSARSCRKSVS